MNDLDRRESMRKVTRVSFLLVMDIVLINLAAILALLVRMDFNLSAAYGDNFLDQWALYSLSFTCLSIVVFVPMKLYNSLWEFASIDEFLRIVISVIAIALCQMVLVLTDLIHLPSSFPVLNGFILCALVTAFRFSYRFFRDRRKRHIVTTKQKRTMLIGAGSAGMLVLREFQTSENSQNNIVCIVDDDKQKQGLYLRNVKVAGTRKDILRLVESYQVEEIVFALPRMHAEQKQELYERYRRSGCRICRTVRTICQSQNRQS